MTTQTQKRIVNAYLLDYEETQSMNIPAVLKGMIVKYYNIADLNATSDLIVRNGRLFTLMYNSYHMAAARLCAFEIHSNPLFWTGIGVHTFKLKVIAIQFYNNIRIGVSTGTVGEGSRFDVTGSGKCWDLLIEMDNRNGIFAWKCGKLCGKKRIRMSDRACVLVIELEGSISVKLEDYHFGEDITTIDYIWMGIEQAIETIGSVVSSTIGWVSNQYSIRFA